MTDKCNCQEDCNCSSSQIPPCVNDNVVVGGYAETKPELLEEQFPEMEVLRIQELNTTLDELTDQEINIQTPEEITPDVISLKLGLGLTGSLWINKIPFTSSTPNFIWENSNPLVVCLNPTQSLVPGTVLGLSLGTSHIKATDANNPEMTVEWDIEVVPVVYGNPEEGDDEEEKPKEDEDDINPEEIIENMKLGGEFNLNPTSPTQLDLRGTSLSVDGVTLKLNLGKNVTILNEGTTFDVKSGGILEISGEGKIVGGEGKDGGPVLARPGAQVLLHGGNFIATADGEGAGNSCIYSTGGSVKIDGGTYESAVPYNGKYYTLNISDKLPIDKATDYISATGGTFKNQDPEQGDPGRGGSFVADGYRSVVEGSGEWKVVKA